VKDRNKSRKKEKEIKKKDERKPFPTPANIIHGSIHNNEKLSYILQKETTTRVFHPNVFHSTANCMNLC
jgi:hypothetical protein